MKILVENPALEEIVIQDNVDHVMRGHRINLATAQTIKGNFGQILTQHITFDDFIVWHHMLHIKYPVKIYAHTSEAGLPIIFALKGSVLSEEKCHISEGQCLVATAHTVEGKQIEPGEYEFLHVDMQPEYLEILTHIFPMLKDAVEQGNNPKAEYRGVIPVKALLRIHSLLNNETGGMTRKLMMESNVKQILLYTIEELSSQKVNGILLPFKEKQKLEAVKSYIINNLDEKVTLSTLIKRFGIAGTTLKNNFRNLYNITIHEYIIKNKIEYAKLLLQEGEDIQGVADKVGYPELSNFTRAFKRVTGLTPSIYRSGNIQ